MYSQPPPAYQNQQTGENINSTYSNNSGAPPPSPACELTDAELQAQISLLQRQLAAPPPPQNNSSGSSLDAAMQTAIIMQAIKQNQPQQQAAAPTIINNNNNNSNNNNNNNITGAIPVAIPILELSNWSVGLFDCCRDPLICFCSLVFPCHVCGLTRSMESFPVNSCNGYCEGFAEGISELISWYCCWICAPLVHGRRSNFRQRQRILGDQLSDCIIMIFCNPCAITQEYNELKARTSGVQIIPAPPPVAMI